MGEYVEEEMVTKNPARGFFARLFGGSSNPN
jgi:hypothetical protein